MSRTLELACPRDTDDGEDCVGVVKVELEYEPPDNNYGADADGNRGIRVPGYWSAYDVESCTLGHTLTEAEQAEIKRDAEYDAVDEFDPAYDSEYGGDGPED